MIGLATRWEKQNRTCVVAYYWSPGSLLAALAAVMSGIEPAGKQLFAKVQLIPNPYRITVEVKIALVSNEIRYAPVVFDDSEPSALLDH